MNFMYDAPRFDMSKSPALVIFFNKCNVKCKYCDISFLKKFRNGDQLNLDKILPYVDDVVFSGGEPLMFFDELVEFVKTVKQHSKSLVLYTNALLLDRLLEVIDEFDNVVIDVKGTTTDNILDNVKMGKRAAATLLENYKILNTTYADKIEFRVNQYIERNDFYNELVNKTEYTTVE
ncbi:pyruvate-formate lyase-activating enzyme [Methanococcus maripaludis]|uniref:Pyruvate-formate lyase-activating enzyme n=1 Tax=Methanococcus maripaludis TaxID=39152 RepID=A0A7J9NWW4_METMI|nr:radical SAM protein [Methanococcus maripaludis]MBA2851754.1 pyruvate-formate lyase-activating enzyme [Methanococcus maripaludis]